MKLRTPIVGGALALATTLAPHAGLASSHREAPFIAKNPKVDGTDYYAFMSYETGRAGYVTLLANYQGLQDGYGGPNYFTMDPDAIYEIHVDNTGDGVEDITFQFDFDLALAGGTGIGLDVGPTGQTKHVAVPFHTLGPVSAADETLRNVLETYKVNVIRGPRRTGTVTPLADTAGKTVFGKPVDNAGPKTIADYTAYSNSFIRQFDLPGCTPTGVTAGSHGKIFVGQRKDGFAVNLGQIFDLVNMQPKSAPAGATNVANVLGAANQGFNTLTDKNVTTIAIEVPASCLTAGTNTKFGTWTTASVRQARVINPTGTFTTPAREGGPWVQVSRLGMPLVNEVVIGLPDKNKFNNSEPKDDVANFANYVTNPTLPEVIEVLFGSAGVMAPNRFPRGDLLTVFTQGYPGVNDVAPAATAVPSEMIRINAAFGSTPAANQAQYGAITCFDPPTATADATLNPSRVGCDPAGFPNGRRPADDVVDVSIRAAMGALLKTADAPAGALPFVDGAAVSATADFDQTFPYLKPALPGAP
jgi:hypothetical protein